MKPICKNCIFWDSKNTKVGRCTLNGELLFNFKEGSYEKVSLKTKSYHSCGKFKTKQE